MNRKIISTAVLACLLAFGSTVDAKKLSSAPKGTKVISGRQFDIYVELKESRPFPATSSMLNIYSTTVVVHHAGVRGRQHFVSRMEAFDANLLEPSMWQIGDFNGDGYDDYRAVSGINNEGCHTWTTQVWLPKRARFSYHTKITHVTDANGREIESCYPK